MAPASMTRLGSVLALNVRACSSTPSISPSPTTLRRSSSRFRSNQLCASKQHPSSNSVLLPPFHNRRSSSSWRGLETKAARWRPACGSLFSDSDAFGELLGGAANEAIKVGSHVRVNREVRVFHVRGGGDKGFNLEGFEGVVVGKADDYEGRPTTANLPYKVKFEIDAGGKKPKKVFAHLTESEIEGIKKEG